MSATAPLLGREAEIRALERALDAAERGTARWVGVFGEPGIGKSRLLAELGRRAAERGHLVLAGRAAELERDVPFALWGDALQRSLAAAASKALSEQERAELAVALPTVAGVAPAVNAERHRVARAVRALLERLAAEQPVTLLLDDAHWADPASADVLALLAHRPPDGPALLALAARTGRAPALEAALEVARRHGGADVLEVGALPRAAADALLASLGPAARERLYRESGGNPFYLEALSRADDAPPGARTPVGAAGVPRAVMAALAAEIAALEPEARRLVQGAAVAGDPFDPAIAAAAADLHEAAALSALDAALAAELVRPTSEPRRFRFRHPLVRRAVYEGAGGGWRLAAHARAAEALQQRGASATARAHHVERAAQPGDLPSIELLSAAAEQTLAAAPETAAGWYATALRLLPVEPQHEARRRTLLGAHAAALASSGHAADARDALRRLLALLPADATDERVEVVVMLAELEALWTQNPEEARRLLAAERANAGDAPRHKAALSLAMAGERAEYGDFAAVEAHADDARRLARAAGDRALEGLAAATAADGAQCNLRGDDASALAAVDAKVDDATALIDGLPDDLVAERLHMLLELTIAQHFVGRFSVARATAERGLGLARRTGQGLHAPAFVCVLGYVDYELGRLEDAEREIDEALESALITGNVQVEYWSQVMLGPLALARGRPGAAIEPAQRAWRLLGDRPYSQAGFRLADALLATGDPEGALAALEAFEWVRPQMWTLDRVEAVDVAVRVLLALGRVDEAAAFAPRALTESGGRRTGVFGAVAAHARAGVLLARGQASEAAAVALAGAQAGDAGDAPLWAARCRTLAGRALGADGRAELRRAAADLEARGAWGFRDAALRELRRLGERPRPAIVKGGGDERLAALSPREREVAALVADGCTNAQIAARLHLSERTVEKHVSSALAKLGVPSRAGVIGLLARERASSPSSLLAREPTGA